MKKFILMIAIFCVSIGYASASVVGTGTNEAAEIGSSATMLKIRTHPTNPTTVYFYSRKKGDKFAIAFNAECSVKGLGNNKWANIDVLVNGVVQSPSTSDNAFCTDHNTNALTNWVSGVTNVIFKSTRIGWNRVQVRATMVGVGSWRFDDKSVIIWN